MITRPLLAIILMCLLVLSCNARRYNGIYSEDSVSQWHKVVEKLKEKIEKLEDGLDSHGRITSIIVDQEGSTVSPQRPRRSTRIIVKSKGLKHKREAIISVVAKKSVVSWRIPSKHHDQHPGIYSDYPKPRSRPPSHN